MKKSLGMITALVVMLMTSAIGCSQASDPTTTAQEDTVEQQEVGDAADAELAVDSANDYRVVDGITLPAPGDDPLAMAFELREFNGEFVGSEQIKVTYPAPDRAVVVSVVRGLPNDSVRATRTRYEFKSAASGSEPLWTLERVTQQNKCQPGRGSQEWTGDLCT